MRLLKQLTVMEEVLYTQSVNRAPARYWDIPSALILVLALLVASQRLIATTWTPGLGIVSVLAMFGLLLGLPLGLSRFHRVPVVLLSSIYSLFFVPFSLAWLLYPEVPWLERMIAIGGRLANSFAVIASGLPLEDTILFLVLFSLVFWTLGLYSGYVLTRSARFAPATLPAGIALVLIQAFDSQGDRGLVYLAVYFFLALFLLGRLNYARRQADWATWRLFSSGEARANINLTVMLGALLLVALAWVIPVSQRSIPPLREWWQEISLKWQRSEGYSNVVAGLKKNEAPPVNNFYGQNLALGLDAEQSSNILFRVQVTGIGGQDRYYWRVRSYDLYQNGSWETKNAFARNVSPRDRSLELPGYVGVNGEFSIRVEGSAIGSLVTPARPIWVSRPTVLTFMPAGGEQVEPLLFRVNQPILAGEEYLVHAILMEPTLKQLRGAGTDYPLWVTDNYLQLPVDLPPAIADLAQEITSGLDTPFEKAEAVTEYLRREITYTSHVPPAPSGRDTLAWFLLDYQAGFCNYYATAEVIMLRSLGIPARLVVGFAQGEYQSPGWYTVHQYDAHAWPEVYFPGVGWVEFEPTTSQPVVARPSGEEATPMAVTSIPITPQAAGPQDQDLEPDGLITQNGSGSGTGGGGSTLVMLMVFFGAVILLGSLLAWAYISGAMERAIQNLRTTFHAPIPLLAKEWMEKNSLPIPAWLERRAWLAGLTPLRRAFMCVFHSLYKLDLDASPAMTPAEATIALEHSLPQAASEITLLLGEYQSETYGTGMADMDRVRSAVHSLQRKTRMARWQKFLRKFSLGRG